MALFNLKLLSFLLISFLHLSLQAEARASYRESCNKFQKCDPQSHLVCKNGICTCPLEESMAFDKERRKCVVLPGKRCRYSASEAKDYKADKRNWDCVINATCNRHDFCECLDNFSEDANGHCGPKGKSYGEACRTNAECESQDNLICFKGRCSCNETEAAYDTKYKQCVSKVGTGSDCYKYIRCVMNANCHFLKFQKSDVPSPSKSDVLCHCERGLKENRKGLCVGVYGSPCSPLSAPCGENFTCIDGKCQCHFPSHQTVDQDEGRWCNSKFGGPCKETVSGKLFRYPCLDENTECRNDSGVSQCLLKRDCNDRESNHYQYRNDSESRRHSLHGSICYDNKECRDRDNHIKDLVCYNGTCSCPVLQEYDEKQRKCRGIVGETCEDNEFCIEGAHCKMLEVPKGTRKEAKDSIGICQCHMIT